MLSEFGEYHEEQEPDVARRLYAWQTAIGLQAVDGLKNSLHGYPGLFSATTDGIMPHQTQTIIHRKLH